MVEVKLVPKEYHVIYREFFYNGPEALELICNELAAEGWRLISTATKETRGIYLFFER